MDPATQSEVMRLLKRGLNHYGLGDLEGAIACWEKARALDPNNQAVRDYLETAYEEVDRTPSSQPEIESPRRPAPAAQFDDDDDTPRSFPDVELDTSAELQLQKALDAFRGGRLMEAWEGLNRLLQEDPDRLEVRGYLELARKQLMQEWAGQIGDRGRSLRLTLSQQEMLKLKLKPEEAFLLTQVDGVVSIDDLISLTSADRFHTLEMLARFLREGVLA